LNGRLLADRAMDGFCSISCSVPPSGRGSARQSETVNVAPDWWQAENRFTQTW
jgi:hypothetical protein